MSIKMKTILDYFNGRTRSPIPPVETKSLIDVIESEATSWERAKRKAVRGKRILMATSMGCYEHAAIVESVLAAALTLRGGCVDFLLCDQFLPCCQMTKIYNVEPTILLSQDHTPRCEGCVLKGKMSIGKLGLNIVWLSHLVDTQSANQAREIAASIPIDQIASFEYKGIAVGEHAYAGALRYYARGDLLGENHGEIILRRYLAASLLTAVAVEKLLTTSRYDTAVFHHGIYVPQGVIGEVCRKHDVHVVNWNPTYRKQTFIFSHEDSYHHTMISEPLNEWENMPWNAEREKLIVDYLKSRWYGTQDWIWFHEKPVENIEAIRRELGIDFSKPCIGMLTSVMWDAQLHYKSNAFKNMLDWVLQTIEYFRNRTGLQLLIRIHPAEVTGLIPSRQKMCDAINLHIPTVPDNVFVIPPESSISTYALMEKCDTVIIYNTKTGIEISSMGIPVIVAGEAWIRNKGFSIDACSASEYFELLDKLPLSSRLEHYKTEKAKKYAYHFFFRRMIELPFIIPTKKHKFTAALTSLKQLEPEQYAGLDVICDGILKGRAFTIDPDQHNSVSSHGPL
jgi:hypothetical protein